MWKIITQLHIHHYVFVKVFQATLVLEDVDRKTVEQMMGLTVKVEEVTFTGEELPQIGLTIKSP